MRRIVFSDIDGTLVSSKHVVTERTAEAIRDLVAVDIPFVPVSARSPSGIYPILSDMGVRCPVVSYSGALVLDANGAVLHSQGFSQETARQLIDLFASERLPLTWCLYATDDWIVADRSDPKVVREEAIVRARAREGSVDLLGEGQPVHKILCICDPGTVEDVERVVRTHFPGLAIVRSSPILLEIMRAGVDKAGAIEVCCRRFGVDPKNAIAFGDNYNDLGMLTCVGHPVVMANAPADIRERFDFITADNDHDGIADALARLLV